MRQLAGLLLMAVLLAACAAPDPGRNPAPAQPRSAVPVENLCPDELPQLKSPTDSEGRLAEAPTSPALLPSTAAWLCHYPLPMTDTGGPGRPLDGGITAVPATELAELDRLIGELQPLSPMTACTQELGPIDVLVVAAGDQQTALIVEHYGCRSTILSDLPIADPVEVTSEGSVPGVLTGPDLADKLAELRPV